MEYWKLTRKGQTYFENFLEARASARGEQLLIGLTLFAVNSSSPPTTGKIRKFLSSRFGKEGGLFDDEQNFGNYLSDLEDDGYVETANPIDIEDKPKPLVTPDSYVIMSEEGRDWLMNEAARGDPSDYNKHEIWAIALMGNLYGDRKGKKAIDLFNDTIDKLNLNHNEQFEFGNVISELYTKGFLQNISDDIEDRLN